jgi:hypothetical protein
MNQILLNFINNGNGCDNNNDIMDTEVKSVRFQIDDGSEKNFERMKKVIDSNLFRVATFPTEEILMKIEYLAREKIAPENKRRLMDYIDDSKKDIDCRRMKRPWRCIYPRKDINPKPIQKERKRRQPRKDWDKMEYVPD